MNVFVDILDPCVSARLPLDSGAFQIALFRDDEGREHLALHLGDLSSNEPVLARVHSECFTGDVLGSRRCDCGAQLELALAKIAAAGRGVLLYLRQEGRGIGLIDKLRAYNLQDQGYDTVDANLALGHEADERDYTVAAQMLSALRVRSLRLMTNNPRKVESLVELGVDVVERIPVVAPLHEDNRAYLQTKVQRMRHVLDLERTPHDPAAPLFDWLARAPSGQPPRPVVTVTYAQSLDGCSSAVGDRPLAISGEPSLRFTHRLRAAHDGILVGIGTVLADNPRLTVRLAQGQDPQPIVLDSRLRFPIDAGLIAHPSRAVWIATTELADPERARTLEARGARIIRVASDARGQVDLEALLERLHQLGIRSLMVEGGGRVITRFMERQLVERLILTIAPLVVGGVRAIERLPGWGPNARLEDARYTQLGADMVVWGQPAWLVAAEPQT